ncbi:putative rab3-GAP regulatory subunit, rab3GAP regulatory subunit [Plasmopara halstedii]
MASNLVEDVLAATIHVDCASLPTSLHDSRVLVDVTDDMTLVLGFERQIYSAEMKETAGQTTVSLSCIEEVKNLCLDESEVIVDVKWINHELFCVGYTTGVVRIFNRLGKLVFEQKLHGAAVRTLEMNRNVSTIMASHRSSALLSSELDIDGELWVLYADSTVAIIQLSEIQARINSAMLRPAQASKFRKYSLQQQNDIVAAFPCGPVRPTIFQSHSRLGMCTLMTAGSSPFLAFYQAGNDQNSIIHLAHIATAIASRAAGAVWSYATSWGYRALAGNGRHAGFLQSDADAIDAAAEHVPAPIGMTRSIYEDERRRCKGLVLSPSGKLAAVADSLGRILLIDTLRMVVIRMWKGYRNAQCGWIQGLERNCWRPGLYLVIYSAQRGIVELWRARYGPKVFSLGVGNSARLITQFNPVTRKSKCIVLIEKTDKLLELVELRPGLSNTSTLTNYFTQNKLQEEQFLLHQVIGGFQAFVKKKHVDTTHSGVLESLLEEIGCFTSSTTIQALFEVFLSSDMALLGAHFLLRALEKLQLALKNGMSSKTLTGVELSLQWKLLWHHRLVSTFIKFQTRSKHALDLMVHTVREKDLQANANDQDSGFLRRLLPWFELLRRAGASLGDESCSRTRKAINDASQLTAWEFIEFFSMPFNDPDLPRRRDILSLYEVADSMDDFLRETFHVLNLPVLRDHCKEARQDCLLTLIFAPLLSNVFEVQELHLLHSAIFFTKDIITRLFIEWYYSLPLGTVIALPQPSKSSSLYRWLESFFVLSDTETHFFEDRGDNSNTDFLSNEIRLRRLRDCPLSLRAIFESCWKTPKLFHGFVLSEHCGWGEKQFAKRAEEDTLGQYSSAGSGTRWIILQDCIAVTVHLSLRLGKYGQLSVDTVEHVDEILRNIAVMQINEGHDPGEDDAAIQIPKDHVDIGLRNDGADGWVATMENCRKAVQMKDWKAILRVYPQLADKDTLCCFRVAFLCAAWNAERSAMRQLEDALLELECVTSLQIKAAMAAYIWEKYIRVHVVTLITFWEESAAGKKAQRGLQPQVARRFFGIISNLLITLLDAVKTLSAAGVVSTAYGHAEADSDYDDELSATDFLPADDDFGKSISRDSIFRINNLTEPIEWHCQVKDLHIMFRKKWPPSHVTTALMQALKSYSFDMSSVALITDHISLIMLLDSFAASAVTPITVAKLFTNNGQHLCRPNSLLKTQMQIQPTEEERSAVGRERSVFLKELLRHDDTLGFALAEAFGLSLEVILEEYVLYLYQSGQDERADVVVEKMKRPERLAIKLGAIARARLSLILRRMKVETEYAAVMSMLPADVFTWVVNNAKPPLVADPLVEELDHTPSLTSTHCLLLRCLTLLVPSSEDFEKVSAMLVLVKDVISQVKVQS